MIKFYLVCVDDAEPRLYSFNALERLKQTKSMLYVVDVELNALAELKKLTGKIIW